MPKQKLESSHALGELNIESRMMKEAMTGDISFSITPATVTPAPTSEAWTRTVVIKLVNTAGEIHTWVNEAYTTTLAISDTSTAGTASITSTTLTIVNGEARVIISGDANDWLDTETDTLTVSNITVMGYTITGGTSIETFTA